MSGVDRATSRGTGLETAFVHFGETSSLWSSRRTLLPRSDGTVSRLPRRFESAASKRHPALEGRRAGRTRASALRPRARRRRDQEERGRSVNDERQRSSVGDPLVTGPMVLKPKKATPRPRASRNRRRTQQRAARRLRSNRHFRQRRSDEAGWPGRRQSGPPGTASLG